MINVALVVLVLPQASVAVNTTVTLPDAPQVGTKPVKLLLQVTLPQTSLAVAPPLADNHPFNNTVLPAPSHSTVKSSAGVSIEGARLS